MDIFSMLNQTFFLALGIKINKQYIAILLRYQASNVIGNIHDMLSQEKNIKMHQCINNITPALLYSNDKDKHFF